MSPESDFEFLCRNIEIVVHVLKMSLSRFTNFVFPLLKWLPVLVITKVLVRMRKIHVKKDPWIIVGRAIVKFATVWNSLRDS